MAFLNPTAPLRSGFDYQDLWAVKLCKDRLLAPSQYQYISIEYNPTDDNDFFLDDLNLKDKSGLYHLYQAKFKMEKDYEWTWDDLLEAKISKRDWNKLPSLLKKRVFSLKSLWDSNIFKACLITNAKFSDDIKKYLVNSRIDIIKLKKQEKDLYKRLLAEIWDDTLLNTFFNKFEFISENKEFSEIENEIEESLHKDLWITKAGINSLYHAIKAEARKQQTIKISLEEIRGRCEFDNPRQLNENFQIPSDFQLFDEKTYTDIFQALTTDQGGNKIVLWKPGAGKSVFLSHLARDLGDKDVLVIKHHYHINPAESNSFERLGSERVIEAIKAQFKKTDNEKLLWELANKNSKDIPLNEFIKTVVCNLAEENKWLVIIIDGLDHVIRERDINELKSFLDAVFYPQKGLWIILWTQPQVKNEKSLQSIFSKFKESDVIEIKGLNKDAIFSLVSQNETGLNLPTDQSRFNDFVNQLFTITEGNPLHLHYTLDQLKNRFNNQLINAYELREIISYGGDIKTYYWSLRHKLDDETKNFLLTFISVGFQFTRKQFIECISSFDATAKTTTTKFNEVDHLIDWNKREKWRIYHNSFEVFLHDQQERKDQKDQIKLKIKNWLEKSSYENLKWAELKKLEYDLWEPQPILSLDRSWLIEALIHPRNRSQITSQLEYCRKASFSINDLALGLKSTYLKIYYQNGQDYIEDWAEWVQLESIKLNPHFIDDLILSDTGSSILTEIAKIAEEKGHHHIIQEIIDILSDRLWYQDYRNWHIPPASKAIVDVIAYDRQHHVERVFNFIIQFREEKVSWVLFKIYAERLLSLWQHTKIHELLKLKLNEKEKISVLNTCIYHDLHNKERKYIDIISKAEKSSYIWKVYLLLNGKSLKSLQKLPEYKDFPPTIPEHGSERHKWSERFHKIFLLGLTYSLSGQWDEIKERINKCPKHWSVHAASILFQIALKVGESIQKSQSITYTDLISDFSSLPDLTRSNDRHQLDLKFALKDSISTILEDILYIKHSLNDNLEIDSKSFPVLIATPFFSRDDLTGIMTNLDITLLPEEIIKNLLEDMNQELADSIDHFSNRSQKYIKIAEIASLYKLLDQAKHFLWKAAENLLGYGYHKDPYLFDVLDAIELCIQNKVIDQTQMTSRIKEIVPSITNVWEYTDWDETHHLPVTLAEFLAKFDQNLLLKYHYSEADKEELYSSQDIFKYLLTSFKFNNQIESWIATTALDEKSYIQLQKIALTIPEAEKPLDIINTRLGNLNYKKEDSQTYIDKTIREDDYKDITLDKLEAHLSTLTTKRDHNQYILSRTKYRLPKADSKLIYQLLDQLILGNEDLSSVYWELLDLVYPLAYEFDNEKAFKLLCQAQINDHWRSAYFTDIKKAKARREFLKENYPKRHLEFFYATIEDGVPLTRGIEFFIGFNDNHNAYILAKASIEFLQDLMCDLKLKKPVWLEDDYKEIDLLDTLFQRLERPSQLVREAAAIAIAEFLIWQKDVYIRLLSKIQSSTVESLIVIYLLPILKAFQNCTNKDELNFIDINEIIGSIKSGSVVIEKLLDEINFYIKADINTPLSYLPIKQPSADYIPNILFTKYVSTFLAPAYLQRAKNMEKQTWESFIDLRSYNAQLICEENSILMESNHDFYGHSKNGKFLLWYATKVSEAYRSAFIRVVNRLYLGGHIDLDDYLEHSLVTLPIDLSFWQIWIGKIPTRRPMLTKDIPEWSDEIWEISLTKPINNLINLRDATGKMIIAAEGAIQPPEGRVKDPKHSYRLIAFWYRIFWTELPSADDVAQEIFYSPVSLLRPSDAKRPLSFLLNENHFDFYADPTPIKDSLIFPIVTRCSRFAVSFWQYYRDKISSFNLNRYLRNDLKIDLSKEHRSYKDEWNEVVIFSDWLWGLKERYEFEMPLPYWQYALMDESFLTRSLSEEGFRVWYLLETTYRIQKYSYDDIKEIINYEFINFSAIIT